jgi:hypothetical protein
LLKQKKAGARKRPQISRPAPAEKQSIARSQRYLVKNIQDSSPRTRKRIPQEKIYKINEISARRARRIREPRQPCKRSKQKICAIRAICVTKRAICVPSSRQRKTNPSREASDTF